MKANEHETLYDWFPGRRGSLLVAKGSKSKQNSVAIPGSDDALLRQLYESGRLTGRALDDARLKYEGHVEPL